MNSLFHYESWPGMNRGSLSLRNCRQFIKVITLERVLFLHPKKWFPFNLLVFEFWNINPFAKLFFFFFKEGIMEKISYERRAHESVDDRCLP